MSSKRKPITPYVIDIANQLSPYQLPQMERLEVAYHGALMIRLRHEGSSQLHSRPMSACWALPGNESIWLDGQRLYQMYQQSLDELANLLRALGTYAHERERRLAAKAMGAFANPLCQTVILAPLPDQPPSYIATPRKPPVVQRTTLRRHTRKMLILEEDAVSRQIRRLPQTHAFLCPNDAAWEPVFAAHAATVFAAAAFERYLAHLGIYAEQVKHSLKKGA